MNNYESWKTHFHFGNWGKVCLAQWAISTVSPLYTFLSHCITGMFLAEQGYKAGSQTFAAVFSSTEMLLKKLRLLVPKRLNMPPRGIATLKKVQALRKFVNLLKNHNCEQSNNWICPTSIFKGKLRPNEKSGDIIIASYSVLP